MTERPKPTLPDPARRRLPHKQQSFLGDPDHPEKQAWMTRGAMLMFIITSVMLIGIGVFQVIFYSSMRDFVSCQATYNQQSSLARTARLDATAEENRTLYTFLSSIQPLLNQDMTQKERDRVAAHFANALDEALRTHRQRIRTERLNPYPQEPAETCGNF